MLQYRVSKPFSYKRYQIQAEKITLLRVLVMIAYFVCIKRDYLYIFFKDVSKCLKYTR